MIIFHLNHLNHLNDLSDLLYTDGVLCELSAAMADQVGAVDPVHEFCLRLEPLHGPCKPAPQQRKRKEVTDRMHILIRVLSFTIRVEGLICFLMCN